MKPQIFSKIDAINREFYQTFAHSFDRTRQRLQPGVARLLKQIPSRGSWLDIGCGNGRLALEWARQRRTGIYYGVDFSDQLIQEARIKLSQRKLPPDLIFNFTSADLTDQDWVTNLPDIKWDGLLMFAVLHHIAGHQRRMRILNQLRELLKADGLLYCSVWQLRNSPRLLKRLQPWSLVGIYEQDLEVGDALVDWRADYLKEGQPGLRYVHLFFEDELCELARQSGFEVLDIFYSDGREGNLGLYQCWRRVR